MSKEANAIKNYRSEVPLVQNENVVYLNSSFQPPMNNIVANAIKTYVNEGLYEFNPKPKWIEEAEEVRSKVSKLLNAKPEDMVYTRDTTESCNLFQKSLNLSPGDNVVLLRGEHPNQTAGWLGLTAEGVNIKFIEVDESNLTPYSAKTFMGAVDEKTKAIGVSSIMFHSGLRNDIKSICDTFRPKGIHVLVDATQEAGYGKIDVKELGVSALAFGIHKGLSCPTGLGLLYIDPKALPDLKEVPPIMSAGALSNLGSDLVAPENFTCFDSARRFEHLNKGLMQCKALGAYLDFIQSVGIENVQEYLEGLGSYLRSSLRSIGVETLGPGQSKFRSPHSNVIPLNNTKWQEFFIDNGVYISQYRCGVRISLGLYNNKNDINRFVAIVKKGIDLGL